MPSAGNDIIEMLEYRKQELELELARVNAAIEAYKTTNPEAYNKPSERVRQLKLKTKSKQRTPWTKLVTEVFEEHDNLTMSELIEILKAEKGVTTLDDEIARSSLGTTVHRMRKSGVLDKDEETGVISKVTGQRKEDYEKGVQAGDQGKLEL